MMSLSMLNTWIEHLVTVDDVILSLWMMSLSMLNTWIEHLVTVDDVTINAEYTDRASCHCG